MIIINTFTVCTDCLLYIANGETDPSMTAEREQAVREGCDRPHLSVGDSEDSNEFSWAPCQLCKSPLGGSRHAVVQLGNAPVDARYPNGESASLTDEQQTSLERVAERHSLASPVTVSPGSFGCVMVQAGGMWLGIERDGHTHS